MKREYPGLGVVFQTVVKDEIKKFEGSVWKFARKYNHHNSKVKSILNESNPLFKTRTIDQTLQSLDITLEQMLKLYQKNVAQKNKDD